MAQRNVLTQLQEAATAIASLSFSNHDTEPRFTACVAGFGLVDWTPERIDAYANGLLRTHVPGRRWTPRRTSDCQECGTAWPCGFVSWAEQWGRSLTRHEAHSHKKPADDSVEGRTVPNATSQRPHVEGRRPRA